MVKTLIESILIKATTTDLLEYKEAPQLPQQYILT